LRVAVRDNGPGLGPEQRQRIFDPFYTTKTRGTGLGMAIAKRIVEAHGGRIAVGEGRAAGAEIIILLPREGQP
jgi:two-component system sensor kinase FixL